MNRRTLLQQALLLRTAMAAVPPSQFKDQLVGPICSVPTVYNADFSLDFPAMRRIVDCGLRSGAQVFALTAGNNQYDRLNLRRDQELNGGSGEGR